MPLAKDLQDYIKSQIDYYTEEAASYKQIAEGYVPEIDSVTDTAFRWHNNRLCISCIFTAFQTHGTDT